MPNKRKGRGGSSSMHPKKESQLSQATPKPAAPDTTGTPPKTEKAASTFSMTTRSAGRATAASQESPKGSPSHVKATGAITSTAGTAGVGGTTPTAAVTRPKETAKSIPVTTITPDLSKGDPAKKSAAAGNVPLSLTVEETKVTQPKAEVPGSKAKGVKAEPALDPFAALGDTLPSLEPVAPPVYTGPEVKEDNRTSDKAVICGEREDTLPPGYRLEDMVAVRTDVKPEPAPKPMSTDEALDSLSAGFMSSAAPAQPKKQEKIDHADGVCASSVSAPVSSAVLKKADAATAPPLDKKSKMEKVTDDLELGVTAAAAKTVKSSALPPTVVSPGPPVDKKPKMEKAGDGFSLEAGLLPEPSKAGLKATGKTVTPKTEQGGSLSLDVLSALGDTLPAAAPKPEPPKLKPQDIVSEEAHEKEKGVLVGEDENTIPPEYRFKDDKLKDLPAPKPEPTVNTGDALDFLSGDFVSCTKAPAVQAPIAVCRAPPQPKPELCRMGPPVVVCIDAEKKPQPVVCPPVVVDRGPRQPVVCRGPEPTLVVCPPVKKAATNAPQKSGLDSADGGGEMSLDALSALGDTLAAAEPKQPPPKLKPEDIISEKTLDEEKGVRVGEREDTIPLEYRFTKEALKDQPAPKPEPTMDTGEALDFLSAGFETCSVPGAPKPKPVVCPPVMVDPVLFEPVVCYGPEPTLECPEIPLVVCPPAEIPKEKTDDKLKPVVCPPVMVEPILLEPVVCYAREPALECPPKIPLVLCPPAEIPKEKTDDKPELVVCPPMIVRPDPCQLVVCHGPEPPAVSEDVVAQVKSSGLHAPLPPPAAKTKKGDSISADALSALGDTLAAPERKPELPKLQPKDIISEKKCKEEEGVLVGEREDTIPPEYRFSEDKLKDLPPPKPEPKMDTSEALDFLSEGFGSASVPAVAPCVAKPPAPSAPTMDFSICPKAAAGSVPAKSEKPPTMDFSITPTVAKGRAPAKSEDKPPTMDFSISPKVAAGPAPPKSQEKPPTMDFSISPSAAAGPAPPKSQEKPLTMDFSISPTVCSGPPAIDTKMTVTAPAKPSADMAIDALAGDLVMSAVAPAVKSAACTSSETTLELAAGADSALDALSDTLMGITPTHKPPKISEKDIIKEKEAVEEKIVKMGERDDTLPPEFRPTEEDLKKMAEAKAKAAAAPKEKPMGDDAALDLLAGDWAASSVPTAPAAPCATATTQVVQPVLDTGALKPMPGPVLDSLANTLLPGPIGGKSKEEKSKGKSKSKTKSKKHHAEASPAKEQPPSPLKSDVVPTSKKGTKH